MNDEIKAISAQRVTRTGAKPDGSYVFIELLGEDGKLHAFTLPYDQAVRFKLDLFHTVDAATGSRIQSGEVPAAEASAPREMNTFRVLPNTNGQTLLLEILSSPQGQNNPSISSYSLVPEQADELAKKFTDKAAECRAMITRN